MDDKQNKNTEGQPEVDELLKNVQDNKTEFGANQSDDINRNVGSFTKTVKDPEPSATQQIKLDVDSKVIEKASKEEVDFEHFSKTKHSQKSTKSKFGEKVGLVLRSKKGLTITWVIELVVMAIIIIMAALVIAFITKQMKSSDPQMQAIFNASNIRKCAEVGRVFLWISIFPCAIPLVYLVTAWFVGINQVASSKIYHYMFWICLIVCIVCFIVGMSVCAKPLNWIAELL